MEGIEFFGGADRKEGRPDGRITSEYPAWMHKYQMDELKESIERKERELKNNRIPFEHVATAREELAREKEKYAAIKDSVPKLSDKQKDDLHGQYKDLAKNISGYLFTRSEMMQGTASAHEEADRMVLPSIEVHPEVARMCNLQPTKDGRISRNDASKAFKIIGHILGEPTNVETLRKDQVTMRTGGRPRKS